MSIYSKLIKIAKGNKFDEPSKVIANQLAKNIKREVDIEELLRTDGFKYVMEHLRGAFIARMTEIVKEDPELRTLKSLFAITLGAKGAEEKAKELFDEFIEN